MKIKYIIIIFILFFTTYFSYLLVNKKKEIATEEGHFTRNVIDSFDLIDEVWTELPHTRNNIVPGTVTYLAYKIEAIKADEDNPLLFFNYYPVEDETDLIGSAHFNTNTHYIYRKPQKWYRRIAQGAKNTKLSYRLAETTLPMQTYRAQVLDSAHLLVWYFDFKQKQNKLAVIDTTGSIEKSYTDIWPAIDDGGLAVNCDLAFTDSSFYCISRYTNNVTAVNRRTGKIKKYKTIERVNDYPAIIKQRNTYSFKRNPYLVHVKTKLLGNKFYMLSAFADEQSIAAGLRNAAFIDVYDLRFHYLYSLLYKNISAPEVLDYYFVAPFFTVIKNNAFYQGIMTTY